MTDQKKKKALLKKLRDKYRLAIFNEQSYEELFVMRLSRLNVFTVAGSIAVLLVVLVTLLIAFIKAISSVTKTTNNTAMLPATVNTFSRERRITNSSS